jgi:hypothetical protein
MVEVKNEESAATGYRGFGRVREGREDNDQSRSGGGCGGLGCWIGRQIGRFLEESRR